ncbi:hypothetical protein [Hafnia alvei]|uniref:hypothetical protein n=1 Tax=Hafnia alvei TaxID=569 RepID=UPI0004B79943|nr:hypothetical protein [Hafnia alvei]MBW3477171.1 hypothetical protein [Hafnia alvei]MDU3158336.1 hypothetical protein [Hafnia alvei]STQ68532.1 Uncharacterised protein [Hafnia alvei]
MPNKIITWVIMFGFSLSLALLASMLGEANTWAILSIFVVTYFICDVIFSVLE